MKWFAVILVILNVAAYLVGLKLDPDAPQIAASAPFEAVNEAEMSVIKPESRIDPGVARNETDAPELVEDELTQLKINNRGQVLTTQKPPVKEGVVKNSSAGGMAKTASPVVRAPVIRTEPNPIFQPRTKSPTNALMVAAQSAPNIESKPVSKPAVKPAPKPKPIVKPAVKPVQPVLQKPKKAAPAPVSTQREPLACYRIGSFDDQAELTAVRRKLKSKSIDFKLEEKTLPGDIKGARVYTGGFIDAAALEQEKQRLKLMKVDNYEVRLNGDAVLQLGYFTTSAGAGKARDSLKGKGIDAKIYTIYKSTRTESWLILIAAPRDLVKALTLPEGVQAREQSCP